jgi:hypothetical protein
MQTPISNTQAVSGSQITSTSPSDCKESELFKLKESKQLSWQEYRKCIASEEAKLLELIRLRRLGMHVCFDTRDPASFNMEIESEDVSPRHRETWVFLEGDKDDSKRKEAEWHICTFIQAVKKSALQHFSVTAGMTSANSHKLLYIKPKQTDGSDLISFIQMHGLFFWKAEW